MSKVHFDLTGQELEFVSYDITVGPRWHTIVFKKLVGQSLRLGSGEGKDYKVIGIKLCSIGLQEIGRAIVRFEGELTEFGGRFYPKGHSVSGTYNWVTKQGNVDIFDRNGTIIKGLLEGGLRSDQPSGRVIPVPVPDVTDLFKKSRE